MNFADVAFMLVATALVMFMTPGLALFYGGLVRSKNVLATIMQSFMCLGLVSLLWFLYAYSLAFGPDHHGLIGDLTHVFLKAWGLVLGRLKIFRISSSVLFSSCSPSLPRL